MLRKALLSVLLAFSLAACESASEEWRVLKVMALSEIGRAQVASGDVTGARETVADAVELANVSNNSGVSVIAAAVALIRLGDDDRALRQERDDFRLIHIRRF